MQEISHIYAVNFAMDSYTQKPEGISIVIPQYNEEANLQRGVLQEILKTTGSFSSFNWEVLIVDDSSLDRSQEITADFISSNKNFSQLQIPHQGKAAAIWEGAQRAKYSWILFTDMDQSTPLSELLNFRKFMDNYDIIIGSRGYFRHNASLMRKLAGIIFAGFRKLMVLREINDTQCGFKLVKSGFAARVFPMLDVIKNSKKITGWSVSAFDVEFLFIAKKFGARIKELEVTWHDQDTSDTKKRKFVRESLGMIKQIIAITINNLRGKYN